MAIRLLRALATAAIVACWAPTAAFARPILTDATSSLRVSGIVVQVTDATHMGSVRGALETRGATIRRTFRWNAYVVVPPSGSDPARFAADARGIGGVNYAQSTSIVRANAAPAASDPLYSQQWGLPDIGAPAAWARTEGSGVSVAVIDTGIDATQPDLVGQVVLFKNYVTPGASATDDEGHGTHVAGIIDAIRNNGVEGTGTAPKARVYAFKALDDTGSGDDVSVAAAIRDAVDLTPCRIISMSLGGAGGGGGDTVLASAVAYAESKGAIVIAAAGNEGVNTASYPAALPGVIGVGAVDSTNRLASFSNYGSADLDLVAPGVNILSTVLGGKTESWDGTSMATPFVSGAAALVWSAHPELSAPKLAALLESTAKDLGATGTDETYGHGLVRPDLALAALEVPASEFTITPSRTLDGSISPAAVQTVATGASATFSITPASGYHVADVLVDGVSIGAVAAHTFTNVTSSHTISASFAVDASGTFTITPSASAGGSISPGTVQSVAAGAGPTFSIAADPGYRVATVLVDDTPVSLTVDGSYAFTNVESDHTISVSFSKEATARAPSALSMRSSSARVKRGVHITLSSTLRPIVASSRVRYEVKRPGSRAWTSVQTVGTAANGASRTSRYKLSKRGTYSFRVRYLGSAELLPSLSRSVKVVVT